MSKFNLSKTSAVLIGLSILATSAGPAFAENLPGTPVKKSTELNKNQLSQQRLTNTDEAILRAKLQTFKDQKKATAAARISANLNKINQNQTKQMQKHLDTMSGILDKLERRVNQPTPDIKDPAGAKAAIATARSVIATASAAVAAQAQKDYTIQATTEGRIRIDAQAMRDKLHKDILALRKVVIDAKQSVANAIRVAKSGKSDIPGKEGTTSGRE